MAHRVAHRTQKFDSARGDLPNGILAMDWPACGGVETANHDLLHCQRTGTQGGRVWDAAISEATAAAEGTAAEWVWSTLDIERARRTTP